MLSSETFIDQHLCDLLRNRLTVSANLENLGADGIDETAELQSSTAVRCSHAGIVIDWSTKANATNLGVGHYGGRKKSV